MQMIGFNNSTKQPTATPWKDRYQQDATIFGKQTYLPIDFHHARNDNTLVVWVPVGPVKPTRLLSPMFCKQMPTT